MASGRTARVGEYELSLPDFWRDISIREKPPLFASNSIVGPGVSFDFSVLVGLGGDEEERRRFHRAMCDGYARSQAQSIEADYHGMHFEGHRFERAEILGPEAIHEYYLTAAYGDLLHFAFSLAQPTNDEEAWKTLFFTLVEGAIVQRGYALARAGKLP